MSLLANKYTFKKKKAKLQCQMRYLSLHVLPRVSQEKHTQVCVVQVCVVQVCVHICVHASVILAHTCRHVSAQTHGTAY